MNATVTWAGPGEGGRSALPTGTRYVTVAKFTEDGETWTKEAWSIVLEFAQPPSEQGNPSVGDARFLSDEAPQERLRPGRSFELYEGAKRVAVVELTG